MDREVDAVDVSVVVPEFDAVEVTVVVCVVYSQLRKCPFSYRASKEFKVLTSSESHFTLIKPNGNWHLNVDGVGSGLLPPWLNSLIMAFISSTAFPQLFAKRISAKLLDCESMHVNFSFGLDSEPNTLLPWHCWRAVVSAPISSEHVTSLLT